jgi:hypothetical protein
MQDSENSINVKDKETTRNTQSQDDSYITPSASKSEPVFNKEYNHIIIMQDLENSETHSQDSKVSTGNNHNESMVLDNVSDTPFNDPSNTHGTIKFRTKIKKVSPLLKAQKEEDNEDNDEDNDNECDNSKIKAFQAPVDDCVGRYLIYTKSVKLPSFYQIITQKRMLLRILQLLMATGGMSLNSHN